MDKKYNDLYLVRIKHNTEWIDSDYVELSIKSLSTNEIDAKRIYRRITK